MLRVRLLWHTPNPEYMCALAMRRCYSALPMEELEKELNLKGESYIKYLMERVKKDGSFDIFEHASFMFEIEGVSRALTHQLIRHRLCSFDQESQRSAPNPRNYIVPPSVKAHGAGEYFIECTNKIWEYYTNLIEKYKVPKQDARYILPNATETKLVMTTNARNLLHVIYMRTGKGAQWEAVELAKELHKIVQPICPNIFGPIEEIHGLKP
jgi:thymidylate synthase (FAD)